MYSVSKELLDFDLTETPIPTDPQFVSLLGIGPKGQGSLVISPNTYVSSLSINVSLSNPTSIPNINLVPITVKPQSVNRKTLTEGSYEVTSPQSGYVALVATSTPNSSISLQEYNLLELSSNVIVLNFLQDPVDNIDSLVSTQISGYSSLSKVSNTASGLLGILGTLGKTLADMRDPKREFKNSQAKVDGAREENTARINGLVKAVREIHLDSEFDSVKSWLKEWLPKDESNETPEELKPYEKSMSDSLGSLVQTEKTRAEDLGAGNTVDKSTAAKHIEASNIRLASGTVLDLHSPSIHNNSEHYINQTKNSHVQTYLSQVSSVNSWDRSEKLRVVMHNEAFNYTDKRIYHLEANSVHESGNLSQYVDHYSLQVGQESGDNISENTELLGDYGTFEVVVKNNFTLLSQEGQIALRSEKELFSLSKANSYFLSKANGTVASSSNQYISAGGTLALAANGPFIAKASTISSESDSLYIIQGSPVFINSGGALPIITDVSTQQVLGYSDISTRLDTQTPEEDPIEPALTSRDFPKLNKVLPYSKESAPKALGHQGNGIVAESPSP